MATTKLGLPTITGNMNADIVRDMNALANAVDGKAGVANGLAMYNAEGKVINADGSQAGEVTQAEFDGLAQEVTAHLADEVKHIKALERTAWNAKETPEGAQAKANKAEQNAKDYFDQEISGGIAQTGTFVDTTTSIAPKSTYTKRFPLAGGKKAGIIRIKKNTSVGYVFFTRNRAEATGFEASRGSTIYVGYDGGNEGVLGSYRTISNSVSVFLSGAWIDNVLNELVVEFYNDNNSASVVLAVENLMWEVW